MHPDREKGTRRRLCETQTVIRNRLSVIRLVHRSQLTERLFYGIDQRNISEEPMQCVERFAGSDDGYWEIPTAKQMWESERGDDSIPPLVFEIGKVKDHAIRLPSLQTGSRDFFHQKRGCPRYRFCTFRKTTESDLIGPPFRVCKCDIEDCSHRRPLAARQPFPLTVLPT